MATGIIVNQLLIFSILIGMGAIAYWRKVISSEAKDNLAKIIINLTLPLLIFSTFSNMEYSPLLIRNGLIVFALAFLNFGILYGVGEFSSRVLGLPHKQRVVHSLHTMLGNTVFLGFPLLDALFPGGVGIFYGAMYEMASNIITFTFGIYKLDSESKRGGWRRLLNMNTGAILLGMVFLLLGIKLPQVIGIPFEMLGKTTTPLSMVYIGVMLASINIRKAIFQKSIFVLSFNKLLLIPTLLSLVYLLFFSYIGMPLSREAFFVLMLQTAMPCQTIMVVLAFTYKKDEILAAANLFVTTLISIISLPVVFYILELFWKLFITK